MRPNGTRRLERANNIADLRRLARRRLPRPIFDYIDGGADDEVTLARNMSAFSNYEIVPDVLTDVSSIKTAATLFRSEEHTSELQSRQYLVCRLLLEKKKNLIHCYHIH